MPDREMGATLATIESWARKGGMARLVLKSVDDGSVSADAAVAAYIDFLEVENERLRAHHDRPSPIEHGC